MNNLLINTDINQNAHNGQEQASSGESRTCRGVATTRYRGYTPRGQRSREAILGVGPTAGQEHMSAHEPKHAAPYRGSLREAPA